MLKEVRDMANSRKDSKGRKLDTGYTQRSDGRYCYRYQVNKKTHYLYDRSLADLKEKVKRLRKELDNGIDVSNAHVTTLNDSFDVYISSRKKLRDTTRNNYIYLYDKFVRDSIGTKIIGKIMIQDVEQFYNNLLDKDMKYGSLKLIHSILKLTFNDAIKRNLISNNPTNGCLKEVADNCETKQQKRFAMTQKEQAEFMNYARNSKMYCEYVPLFTVFLGTGLRVGEMFGLTWEDIDFKNRMIIVNKTLTYKVGSNGKAEFHISPTKTGAGTRTIPMLEDVRKALLQTREKSIIMGKCETVVDGYSDFVFANSRNHVHKPNTINRVIDSIIKKYNQEEEAKAKKEKREPFQIRHFSVHSFRHTFLTNYCQYETNLKTIQGIAGHSDIHITMQVYAEATQESKQESFKNLEGKFKIG